MRKERIYLADRYADLSESIGVRIYGPNRCAPTESSPTTHLPRDDVFKAEICMPRDGARAVGMTDFPSSARGGGDCGRFAQASGSARTEVVEASCRLFRRGQKLELPRRCAVGCIEARQRCCHEEFFVFSNFLDGSAVSSFVVVGRSS